VGRNVRLDARRDPPYGSLFRELLAPGGRVSLAERVPRRSTRLSELAREVWPEGAAVLERIETGLFGDPGNPLVNWDEETVKSALVQAGVHIVHEEAATYPENRTISAADIARWFNPDPKTDGYGKRLAEVMSAKELKTFQAEIEKALAGREVEWRTEVFFVTGELSK
jgi:hypothetical protein